MKRATDVNPKTSTDIDDAAVLEIEEIDCSAYAALVQGANEVTESGWAAAAAVECSSRRAQQPPPAPA